MALIHEVLSHFFSKLLILLFFKGLFKESRHVECSDPDGNVHDDHELCNEVQKPESVRDCETENEEVCIHIIDWLCT